MAYYKQETTSSHQLQTLCQVMGPILDENLHPWFKEVANRGRSPATTHKKILRKASVGHRHNPPTDTRDRPPQDPAPACGNLHAFVTAITATAVCQNGSIK